MTISFFGIVRTVLAAAQGVVPGVEVLLGEQKALIEGKRLGIIASHTSVDRRMRHIVDLRQGAWCQGDRPLCPEHGIRSLERKIRIVESGHPDLS